MKNIVEKTFNLIENITPYVVILAWVYFMAISIIKTLQ